MRIKGHKRNFLPEFQPTTPSTAAVGLKGYAPTTSLGCLRGALVGLAGRPGDDDASSP
jgi:hypothetical protein